MHDVNLSIHVRKDNRNIRMYDDLQRGDIFRTYGKVMIDRGDRG